MIAGSDFKRCPFCGGEAVIIKLFNGRWETGCSEVGCIANSCVATYKTEKAAREAWNRRSEET